MALIASFNLLQAPGVQAEPGVRILETFSVSNEGKPPKGWERSKDRSPFPYEVRVEEGNAYLHAFDQGQSIKLVTGAEWDPHQYPYLRFRWRVHTLPENANEKVKNDSAAGVYVVFERKGLQFYPYALKYVWSTGLKPGDHVRTGRGYNQIVVLRGGRKTLGEWVEETVNVCRDYRNFFEKDPPDVQAIGVLTDANATDSTAEADYDDFVILPRDPDGPDPCKESAPPHPGESIHEGSPFGFD